MPEFPIPTEDDKVLLIGLWLYMGGNDAVVPRAQDRTNGEVAAPSSGVKALPWSPFVHPALRKR
jgi:hypothetical protein